MLKKLNKSNKGFTIIEVLIVLAIAALILLIVFLAIPALQRNSRNTQRKDDVAHVSTSMANYASNNGGLLPTQNGYFANDLASLAVYCTGGAPAGNGALTAGTHPGTATWTGCNASNNNFELTKMGYYKPNSSPVWWSNASTARTVVAPGSESATAVSTNSMVVVLGFGCNSDNSNVDTAANSRAYAILYVTESGSGNGNLICQGN